MSTDRKVSIVEELTGKVAKMKALVLADYQGLKHKQLEELRKALKSLNAEFAVTKNTLLKKAFTNNKKTIADSALTNASGALFAYEDEVAPLKELVKFFKTAGFGKIKSGLLGETALTSDEVLRLSSLPGKNELRAQLVGQLNAPLYGLHNALSWNLRKLVWTLDAVKNSKTN
jgi:large subunit ribosomal protein L10